MNYRSWLRTFSHQTSVNGINASVQRQQARKLWFFCDSAAQEQKIASILNQVQRLNLQHSRLDQTLNEIKKQHPQHLAEDLAQLTQQLNLIKKHLDDEKQRQDKEKIFYKRWGKGLLVAGVTAALVYAFEDYIDEVLRLQVVKSLNFGDAENLVFGPNDVAEDVVRQDVLTYLEEEIEEVSGPIKQIAIIGESGLGKSTLAKQYISRYSQQVDGLMEEKPHWHIKTIAFFDAQYPEILEEQYKAFALQLGIDDVDVSMQKLKVQVDAQLTLRSVRNFLNAKTHAPDTWLLVFDNVKDLELIKGYLPQGKQNGVVIYTTDDAKIFPNPIEVRPFSLHQARCQLTDHEVIELFNLTYGKGCAKIINQEKVYLADSLKRSPGAIVQATAYIKQHVLSGASSQIANYLDQYKLVLKEQTNTIADINQSVAQLAFNQLDNQAQELLKHLVLLNTTQIPANLALLLLQDLNKTNDIQNFHRIIHQLEVSRLIQRTDANSFKLNIELGDVLPLTETDKISYLRNLIGFSAKHLNRSNLELEQTKLNKMFLWQIAVLAHHIERYPAWQTLLGNSYIELVYTKLAIANYYSSFGRPRAAKKVLKVLQKELEEVAQQAQPIDADPSLKAVLDGLSQRDNKLPSLYAAVLYNLGRTCFYLGKVAADNKYYHYLVQAKAARQAIDENRAKYNDQYNEKGLDSILVETNGLLQHLIIQNTVESLQEARPQLAELLKLLNEQSSATDFKTGSNCFGALLAKFCLGLVQEGSENKNHAKFKKDRLYLLLLDLYTRWGQLDKTNPEYLEKGLEQALNLMFFDPKENQVSLPLQDQASPLEKVQANLGDWLQQDQDASRKAQYYNAVGNLLLLDTANQPSQANACRLFHAAITLEQQGDYRSHPLPNAYLGLAKVYENEDPEQALEYIDKCIKLQKLAGMPYLQEERRAAEALKARVEAKKEQNACERLAFFCPSIK
jgi:hypothetical protein